jgi:hypothetical protein
MTYVWLFLSGLLAFNDLPHFLHGISGQKFFLPRRKNRGRKSAPALNVLWGFANFICAVIIWKFMFSWSGDFFAKILTIMAAGLVIALFLSRMFTKRTELNSGSP